jgi:hypothetical protein
MSKLFNTFKDLIDFRKNCPICNEQTIFEIKINDLSKVFLTEEEIKSKDEEIKKTTFKGSDESKIKTFDKEESLLIDFDKNIGYFKHASSSFDFYDLTISCNKEDHSYRASGSFKFQNDAYLEEDVVENLMKSHPALYKKINDKFEIEICNLKLNYELNTILGFIDDAGYQIKLINDFCINKTSFDISEINLDGTQGSFKEKRIDLVDDNFFKLNNKNKVYSKLNAYFLLDDK